MLHYTYTNVLVSSMLKGTSIPGIIVYKAINGPIIPLLNDEILEEYEEVLFRNKFGFEDQDGFTDSITTDLFPFQLYPYTLQRLEGFPTQSP